LIQNNLDMSALMDSKTEKVARIIRRIHQPELKNLLVVGCGSGIEAAILSQQLNVEVSGIDIDRANALKLLITYFYSKPSKTKGFDIFSPDVN